MTLPLHASVQPAVRDLGRDLQAADDRTIKRIIAVLDEVADPSVKQALLDPVRVRLASLNIDRPLRFARLLFMPLDPLIVTPRGWKSGEPAVPRNALAPMARIVRAGLGSDADFIDKTIAGRKTDADQEITLAGEVLWPRAAEILTASSPPVDWTESGLPDKVFEPLARAIAAVLRRGPQLRRLLCDAEAGFFESAGLVVAGILKDLELEPPGGCAMVARLILLQSPHAAALMRGVAGSVGDPAGKAALWQAIYRGTEHMLTALEQGAGGAEDIGSRGLADAAATAGRIASFLGGIEKESGAPTDKSRMHAIRQKLDRTCRERFSGGLKTLLTPLEGAAAPVDARGQAAMEACSRNLRELETEARRFGGAADYDRLLREATAAVEKAAAAGTLTPMRKLRLIEILCGPEAAAAAYERQIAGLAGSPATARAVPETPA